MASCRSVGRNRQKLADAPDDVACIRHRARFVKERGATVICGVTRRSRPGRASTSVKPEFQRVGPHVQCKHLHVDLSDVQRRLGTVQAGSLLSSVTQVSAAHACGAVRQRTCSPDWAGPWAPHSALMLPFFTTLAQVWRCWLKKPLNSWGVMV
jgi:hypothetical protein